MKILVCDDHALIREAMRGVLKELAPDACVIEARDGRCATELIEDNPQLDLLLLDLHLPDQDGFTMLSNLRERRPEISIVVLSASQDRETVRRALGLGALGFIPKNTEREVVLSALRLVLAGGIYIPVEALDGAEPSRLAEARQALPDNVARRLSGALGLTERQMDVLALVMEGKSNKAISRALCLAEARQALPDNVARRLSGALGLTERQMDVLALVMEGKSNKAISRALCLAEHTIKNHLTAIFKALQVTSRTEAVIAVGKLDRELRLTQ